MGASSAQRQRGGKTVFFVPGEPACPSCGRILAPEEMQTSEFVPCPQCGREFIFCAFPALIQEKAPVRAGEKLGEEGEASCFYHPEKRAEIACDHCGRFMCGLCDIEMDGGHTCPACFDAGLKSNKNAKLERSRTLGDSIALWTAIGPIIFYPITLFTAPTAVFLGIKYWKAPTSILGRTKVRQILAILIGLLQIGLWASFLVPLFNL